MIDYKAIADEVDAKAYPDYQTAFDAMSVETITEDKDIQTSDIKKYMILNDLWLGIKSSADPAAEVAMDALDIFESFNLTDPDTGVAVKAKLGAMLDALVTATLISAGDKTAIMAMGKEAKPKWQGIKVSDVLTAMEKRRLGEV